MKQKLKALKEAADECILLASRHKGTFNEPITWADLGCTEAAYYINDSGEEGYFVVIEEAAPDCPDFHRFISEELAFRGYKDIKVRTEW